VAEWLRRWSKFHWDSSRVGSNVIIFLWEFEIPLYPFIMASGLKYPTGGLKIIGGNEAEYLPNGLFNISKYFGIIRCKVTPPGPGWQGNYPILPMR
jgi:hypothetical protein